MATTILRPITEQDDPVVAGIIRGVLTEYGANKPGTVYYDPTTDHLVSLFNRPLAGYWVLEVDGVVSGGSGIYPTIGLPEGYCEVVKLYLLPHARGRGYGKMLINHCFEIARQFGFSHMYLETMPELKNAVGLYVQCGFKYLDGPLGNSGHFGCDLWMIKDL